MIWIGVDCKDCCLSLALPPSFVKRFTVYVNRHIDLILNEIGIACCECVRVTTNSAAIGVVFMPKRTEKKLGLFATWVGFVFQIILHSMLQTNRIESMHVSTVTVTFIRPSEQCVVATSHTGTRRTKTGAAMGRGVHLR